MTDLFILCALGLVGISFGSFVNAAVWRIKVKKDMVNDRSACVHCHHKLGPLDLIPVISWVFLRGKCRYCKKPISVQYPLVELAVAIYFVGSYLVWPTTINDSYAWFDFGLWLIYGVMGAILFVYDLRWQLLPDRIVKPLIALAAVDFVARAFHEQWTFERFFAELLLAVLAVAGLYWVLHTVSKGAWVGYGDVKLGLFMGLALGWQNALLAVFLANFLGVLVIIPGLLSGKLTRKSKVPFGPFLLLGFVIAGLWGDRAISFYLDSIDVFVATLML
jgi:prepilin signal peptidase PulO-like enzyme (type II secretory pathway)